MNIPGADGLGPSNPPQTTGALPMGATPDGGFEQIQGDGGGAESPVFRISDIGELLDAGKKLQELTRQIEAERVDFRARDKTLLESGVQPTDGEYLSHLRERLEYLFEAQNKVHQLQFQVELVSKVVEHASSGVQTVLRTQA